MVFPFAINFKTTLETSRYTFILHGTYNITRIDFLMEDLFLIRFGEALNLDRYSSTDWKFRCFIDEFSISLNDF